MKSLGFDAHITASLSALTTEIIKSSEIEGEQLRTDEVRSSIARKIGLNIHPLNPRQTLIINRMMDDFKGHMNTSKYAKLAKCSTDTALRDIRLLLEWGGLVKNPGKGRSSSYRLANMTEKL